MTMSSDENEAEALARSLIDRLERGEPLSPILPGVRRLADMTEHPVEALWLSWEVSGATFNATALDRRAHELYYEPLHSFPHPGKIAEALMRGETRPRVVSGDVMMATASIAQLESTEQPEPLRADMRESAGEARIAASLNYTSVQKVIQAVRGAVHQFVSNVLHQEVRERGLRDLFGIDATTVFSAGADRLEQLRHAAASLARAGHAADAALQARTAILEMGRLFPAGEPAYRSPLDGKTYDPSRSEKHRLHALIDRLWERCEDQDMRDELANAHRDVETVMSLGSRAKSPNNITHAQAVRAVMAAYGVAHAICFSGGFPPQAHLSNVERVAPT
jgi:hypothetical protein